MKIIIEANGDFIQEDVDKVVSQIESLDEVPSTIRKITFLAVEVLQNVIHHSDGRERKMSYFRLESGDGVYVIKSGNLIKVESTDTLFKKIVGIDLLTPEEVKSEIIWRLNNEEFSDKGGAGLGLLSIKKRANDVKWSIEAIDNQYNIIHFTITI